MDMRMMRGPEPRPGNLTEEEKQNKPKITWALVEASLAVLTTAACWQGTASTAGCMKPSSAAP